MNLVGFDNYEDLVKGIDKTKMVQVRVTVHGKNGDFQRMQWKNPKDVTSSDVVVSKPDDMSMKTAKKPDQPSGSKQRLAQILGGHSRDKVLDFAKQNGVKWVETNHAGINWMRASIAIQKHMDENSDAWKAFESGKDSQQPTATDQKSNPADQGDAKKDKVDKTSPDDKNKQKTAEKKSKPDKPTVDKDKTKQLVDKLGKDNVLETMKAKGITWTETDHKGINWMRAMQALGKHLNDNPNGFDDMVAAADNLKTKQDLQNTQKQVQQLQDLVSQMQKPTAQQVVKTQTQVDILQGLTTDTMSDYEKSHFGDIISSASPESLRNYRTLGMCAGDKESEEYLADLYAKYKLVVSGKDDSYVDIDADPLKNKLQGVVNKTLVDVAKSSLKDVRKKVKQSNFQRRLLEPWVDPNIALDSKQKDYVLHGRGYYPGDRRKECQTEPDGSHKLLHRILDKFKLSSEYGALASEYDQILTEFEEFTANSILLQSAIDRKPRDFSNPKSAQENGEKIIQQQIDELKQGLVRAKENRDERIASELKDLKELEPGGERYLWHKQWNHSDTDIEQDKQRRHEGIAAAKRWYEETTAEIQGELDKMSAELPKVNGVNLQKAIEVRKKLFDPKFTDLNANLYHNRMVAAQISFSWETKKDFATDYPILSKDNLDKLEQSDEDSLVNLSLYAGMFKPSLTKGGKDAKDVLLAQFAERKAILDAYGGVNAVQDDDTNYSENNEVKCKISKVNPAKTKELTDKIAADWDKMAHGSMTYKIKGIYEVSGLAMESDFTKIKNQNSKYKGVQSSGKNCDSDLFYHGTGSMATSLILGHSGEFKIVKAKVGRMLGNGIYLADRSSKSAQYIHDSGFSRRGGSGSLMVVEASLGNTLQECSSGKNTYKYDSVHAGKSEGLLNNEWCVHDTHAIIPRYLVQMELV